MKKPSKFNLFLAAIVVLVSCRFISPDARAEDKGKYKKIKSFSKVLEKADDKVGKGMVSLPYSYEQSPASPEDDKTLAPYFYVAGGDPDTDRLPLKETSADVKIAGVIAQVRINQRFTNDGKKPIEAVYVFPASTRAAVHAMRMKIGERTVEAKIEEREEAKQQYEQAKSDGKRASLLEQQRPNVFTMNVANIMPGDNIKVELDYSELLVPEDATYEFVYPTVVGPRYGGGADPEKDKWISNPYLKEGEKETYKFDIRVDLETGIALKEVTSPSHKVAVNFNSKSSAGVKLDQDGGGNKDFILRYRLAGDKIESGVLLYQHKDENFFVVMMEPPERPTSSQIPPREYIFVQDVSGSMYGFPLDTSKAVMTKLFSSLRSTDYFNLVLFAGASYKMSEKSVPATDANIKKAMEILSSQKGGGGTELMDGLRTAYSIPKAADKGVSRTVVVCTDGYVGVEAQAFKFVRNNLSDANLFAFGIGSSVNRALIEGMARAGMGEPFVVLNQETAAKEAEKFKTYIESPVLTDIKVELKNLDAIDVMPEEVPDLMAQRPIVLMGKYKGDVSSGQVKITGVSGSGSFSKTMDLSKASSSDRTAPLRVLWARKWVSLLDDQMAMLPGDKELREAVTSLGLQYSILTSYTSFVAIDSEVVNKGGSQTTVNQPLPLPEGVSNYAVGGSVGYKAQGSAGGYYPSAAPTAAAEYAAPKMKKGKSSSLDLLASDKDEKKSGSTSLSVTFSTQPAGSKLGLLKRKHLESVVEKVLEKKFKDGKIPGGTTLTLTVTIKLNDTGSFSSLTLSGDPGYGLKKALEAELKSLSGCKKFDSIDITVVFSTP